MNEIQITAPTGLTLYFVRISLAGLWWNRATQAYEAQNVSNWANYVNPLVEPVPLPSDPTSQLANSNRNGWYFGTPPGPLPVGVTLLSVYQQLTVPGSPASTDTQLDVDRFTLALEWDGAAIKSLAPLRDAGGPGDHTIQLPTRQTSLATAQAILNQLYDAQLKLLGNNVEFVSVAVDGQTVQFRDPDSVQKAIVFWERKVALLSKTRRRVSSIRLDRF